MSSWKIRSFFFLPRFIYKEHVGPCTHTETFMKWRMDSTLKARYKLEHINLWSLKSLLCLNAVDCKLVSWCRPTDCFGLVWLSFLCIATITSRYFWSMNILYMYLQIEHRSVRWSVCQFNQINKKVSPGSWFRIIQPYIAVFNSMWNRNSCFQSRLVLFVL